MPALQQIRNFHATARKLDFSKMSIVGRIGTPFTEYTSAKDVRYVKYAIASQPRKDGPTNWYNITVFNEPQMNFLQQYVRKGALVYVEADAANHTYEREDGSKATSLSLIQKDINLLRNGKPEETAETEESA
ncbi:Rim1 protein [Maudiozyma humilis]|uniref:Single-stranded DNA-binding protein n=1 Tax=Maudiozyma humilis TaxID=51915 RepID=A0AAV5RVM3_MAUHU|nr:Rim1 protein [Kazachstania humilis]